MRKPQQHRHTMSKKLLYVGLDVHAQTVSIAIAEPGGEVRSYGTVSSNLETLEKTMRRIRKAHPGCELRVCYEAGPTGFVIARHRSRIASSQASGTLTPTSSPARCRRASLIASR